MTAPPILYSDTGRPYPTAAERWQRPAMPATPASAWTYAEAKAAVEHATYGELTPTQYEANRAIVEQRDHWRDGLGWMGPNGGGVGEVWRLMKAEIERQFTPVDVVNEALTRHANALLKVEPGVEWVPVEPAGELVNGVRRPSEAQVAEATTVRRALAGWWDRRKLWRKARKATKRARWATRTTLRVYVDAAERERGADGATLPTADTLDAALARVQLDAPEPTHAAVVEDLTTGDAVAVLLYARAATGAAASLGAENVAQVWVPAGADTNGVRQYDVTDVPERLVGARPAPTRVTVDRLPFAELSAELLVTEAVRRQQLRHNFHESSVVRTAETSAFRERHMIDLEPTGVWLEGEPIDGEDIAKVEYAADGVTVVRRLVRKPPTLGANVVGQHVSIEAGPPDADGNVSRANGQIIIADAQDPEFVLKTARHSRGTILQSVAQGHVLRPTDQQVSGYSQEQARADFGDDATNVKSELEAMLRDILEAALAWALQMAPAGGFRGADGAVVGRDFLARFRCVVTLTVVAGPLSEGERRALLEEYSKGLRSRESTMALLGVEDVDAELALLEGGPDVKLQRFKLAMEALDVVQRTFTADAALRVAPLLGVDPQIVAALRVRDTDDVVDGDEGDDAEDLAA